MAKASKVTVPVTIAPTGGTNRVIALNQAIQSFSYEDRQARLRAFEDRLDAGAGAEGDDKPEVAWNREFDGDFEHETKLIVDRAEAFAKFLKGK